MTDNEPRQRGRPGREITFTGKKEKVLQVNIPGGSLIIKPRQSDGQGNEVTSISVLPEEFKGWRLFSGEERVILNRGIYLKRPVQGSLTKQPQLPLEG